MAVLTIHATNVTGLGACQVVLAFLEAIETLATPYERIDCYVAETGLVAEYVPILTNSECCLSVEEVRRH